MTFKIETAVVTGAVTGVGAETALLLAVRGVRRLVLLNRSAERTQPLLGRLKKRYPAVTATVVEGDLAEADGVRAAAMELARWRRASICS